MMVPAEHDGSAIYALIFAGYMLFLLILGAVFTARDRADE